MVCHYPIYSGNPERFSKYGYPDLRTRQEQASRSMTFFLSFFLFSLYKCQGLRSALVINLFACSSLTNSSLTGSQLSLRPRRKLISA